MSLNSLQDDMSRRAASMAAMAKRATNPQQIEAIQKSLITGVQSGAIQPYVGIPLIQELTKKLTEAKAQMAQAVTGAGMPPPPQGGAPIAQQVMAQAAQADQSQGVEALQSNLPESYAGGGIIAFEDGGKVERYQNTGYTGESERKRVEEAMAKLRTYGLRQRQQDPQGYAAAEAAAKEAQDALSNAERGITGGPVGAMGKSMGIATPPVVAPTATPAASNPIIPYGQSRANILGGETPPAAPVAPVAPAIPGAGNFKMPALPTMKETAAPVLTDLDALTKKLPAETKTAVEAKVKEAQNKLEAMDKPGFEAREERLGKREAGLEKDTAISRALGLISTGFGVAGSKERSLAGALGKEGREGIADLIRGEAANRAAKDKLEDYRDNLEQQKVAAKKGNYQAAEAAGERAADNLYKYTSLNLNAASAGNNQAIQRQQIQQQGNFQQASLAQSGILGLSELELRKNQLNQSAATANAQLQLGRERLGILKDQITAGNERAKATLLQAENKIASTWQSSPDYQKAQAQSKKMPPVEAQVFMQQAFMQYKGNMLPSLLAGQGGGANIPSFADAMKAME
jgi:hypothetical protein